MEEGVPEAPPGVVSWRILTSERPGSLPDIEADWPAMMVYTSGTTGKPKRFLLNSHQIWANIEALRDSGLVTVGDRILLPLPLHHAYPFIVGLLTPLESGAMVVFPQSVTGHAIVQALRSAHVTIMVGVPRLYAALLTALDATVAARGRLVLAVFHTLLAGCIWLRRYTGWSPGRLVFRELRARMGSNLRLLVSGGAKLDPGVMWRLEGLGWSVRSGYGLAETASVFTANLPGLERLGTEGCALGKGKVRIGHSGDDGVGEIELRGPCVFDRYIENPEADATAFTADRWFRTGDLGYLDKDGFLYVTGRAKETLVLGGGKKVFPEHTERVYEASPFIGEVAVLERSGALVALVVPNLAAIRSRGAARPEDAIRISLAELSARLPPYARVSGFALTRQPLPRTRLGKYRRFLLPALYDRALKHAEPQQPGPIGPEDKALLAEPTTAALWTLLTKRFAQMPITPDSSLQLDLGLDSLGWMALALEIENRLGVHLDESAVNRILTVRDLLHETQAARKPEVPFVEATQKDALWLKPRGILPRVIGSILYVITRVVMRVAFRLRVEGAENLPRNGAYIIAANHTSYLDPPSLAAALPWHALRRVYWSADRTLLFSNWVSRFLCRAMRLFPVDQRSPGGALASAMAVLRQGHVLVWFPEGWRSPTGELLSFQPGIGRLLQETDACVVPTYIAGAFESLPRGRRMPRFNRITIRFGPVLSGVALGADRPERDWQSIANSLRKRMAELGGGAGY
jgi:long-chain acyl-CoA synthetase